MGDVTRALVAQVTSPMVVSVSQRSVSFGSGAKQSGDFEEERVSRRDEAILVKAKKAPISPIPSLCIPSPSPLPFGIRDRNYLLDVYCQKVSTIR